MSLELIKRRILFDGVEDWGYLAYVRDLVWAENKDKDLASIKKMTLDIIESLAADGLIEIGSTNTGKFIPWSQPVADSIRTIGEFWSNSTDDEWYYYAWINNTEKGDKIGRTVEAFEWASPRSQPGNLPNKGPDRG